MSSVPPGIDAWVTDLAPALGLDAPADVPTELLLDVTRDVAHDVLRPAGPITTYLIGLAVARGMSPADAAAAVRATIESRAQ